MVNLTRIYTKTGDDGTTSLGDMSRTSKNDPRLEAYATVDEANSNIGVVLALGQLKDAEITKLLVRIQNDLFDLGADLAGSKTIKITKDYIDRLELYIDGTNGLLEPLESFVLPTGPLHFARTVVRRAERKVWFAIELHDYDEININDFIPQYLNRLSDLLFVLARDANKEQGDELWVPGANR